MRIDLQPHTCYPSRLKILNLQNDRGMFNSGAFIVLRQAQDKKEQESQSNKVFITEAAQTADTKWQELAREGMVVEAVKEARALGLNLSEAYALVNEFRKQEGLMPAKTKRWWGPFS